MVGRIRKRALLSKKELELVTDWLAVRNGKLSPDTFFEKWLTKSGDSTIVEDLEKVRVGEISLDEFYEKWSTRGKWNGYLRNLEKRLREKREIAKKELELLDEFFSLLPPSKAASKYLELKFRNR